MLQSTTNDFYFAAVGDVHGQMQNMVKLLSKWESRLGIKLAFVLQVGDFEPHRHEADLSTMSAPTKYKKLGDFPDYYSEKKFFPWPIYFIGGNHEPYGFLEQFPKGQKIINNCYYLGRVSSNIIKGLNVVGLSGIYQKDKFHSLRPHFLEIYTKSNKEYIYFNEDDIAQAIDYKNADILLLHDCPSEIVNPSIIAEIIGFSIKYGDEIGNEFARMLVDLLLPKVVLCGHIHYKHYTHIVTSDNRKIEIYCLADINKGDAAIELFRVTPDGEIQKVLVD
ncbi:metallophosphoesterase [Nostoc sp. FACHB-190]|uniref:metallophosphoesterase n=1 Tax=Nostoc sp. FACHB-190 TaxID=2692838 RepID=UPI00168391A8|nr:metallophosphoesterase [Nostoc sp. FACHB-190]MBD2300626.1 metallophosphoesterase [Nostoc sp. FACHB-190]